MKRRTTTRRKKAVTPKKRSTRRVTRKKGMLSELFNANMAQAGGRTVLSGAVGGVGAGLLYKMLPEDMPVKTKAFYTLAGGFLSAVILKMPNVGAGMAGVGMYTLATESGYLSEDSNLYADDIEALPLVLDEDYYGDEDMLEEDGMYLQDDNMYLQENGMYLQEDGMYLQEYGEEDEYLEEDDLSYDVGYYGAGFGLDQV
jgi:hypothetical protein